MQELQQGFLWIGKKKYKILIVDFFTCGGIFDIEAKDVESKNLQKQMEEPTFWQDQEQAESIIRQCNSLKQWVDPYKDIQQQFQNLKEMLYEADKTDDTALMEEFSEELDKVEKKVEQLEIKKMLSHELDEKSCFCSINAGAGGTESCDWVAMLSRMYERWAAKKNWKISVVDEVPGEVAGIKSITFKFEGSFAYGFCKSERGVHRLVRISPFDSNARRHTSFASVDIIPIIDDTISIDIDPSDLRIDTFRSSGAGGQHVNTTDSAVRITHLPTNIIVSCQNERSQTQNKETCMKMLRSKLYQQEVMKREQEIEKIGGEKKEIAWGSQIRNYVFHPYNLVKDTRTKVETSNIHAVMDGNIEEFVHAYLKEFG